MLPRARLRTRALHVDAGPRWRGADDHPSFASQGNLFGRDEVTAVVIVDGLRKVYCQPCP